MFHRVRLRLNLFACILFELHTVNPLFDYFQSVQICVTLMKKLYEMNETFCSQHFEAHSKHCYK